MASQDFEREKKVFDKFYDRNRKLFDNAMKTYIHIISSLLDEADAGEVTKIEGRVKEKAECIRKFKKKYLIQLEVEEKPFEIKDHISDLIGIRIVCLYEDQIKDVFDLLSEKFTVIEVTDKTFELEHSEETFGYKGLHMDLVLNDQMSSIPDYGPFAKCSVEVQIRSLIQDAWSVLDHKIKYKKSIPHDLKRRINILSALFELADQEFKEIRNATNELVQKATIEPLDDSVKIDSRNSTRRLPAENDKTLNAFNFLRVARHFFREVEFKDEKIDDFVQEILKAESNFQKSHLHLCLLENLKVVRKFSDEFITKNDGKPFGPYTLIRYCLYLYNKKTFGKILIKRYKKRFEDWLKDHE